MRKYLSIYISLVAITLAVISLVNSNSEVTNQEIVAGVLRSEDERGWYAIDNDNHRPINIGSVKAERGLIVVNYIKELGPINTFIAAPDETFAKEGFLLGASVSRNQARILVSKVEGGKVFPIDASTIRSKWGNIWVYGLFEEKANNY